MTVPTTDSKWAAGWFDGYSVLVTGGTSGIGAAISRAFLSAGAHVSATGAFEAELEGLANDPHFAGTDLKLLDVRDGAAVNELIAGLPTLDILVNCAGIIRRGEELDPAVFEQVINVNLTGTMRACAAARPLLARSGRGAIVNLASMLSIFGGGLVPAYSASKGGISQLTKSLAIAYSADAIRVNAIAPGWIETPLTTALREDPDRSAAILARTPLGRWGKPEEIANAALYLGSPIASFVTGTILVVDGGYSVT
jgi:NAD(P)-dependent dehydrogenase (short-subunit alcohol dehydrogenase family)